MEFIPLEKYSKKTKTKESIEEQKDVKHKKLKESETSEEVAVKKTKSQTRTKVFEKKKVKNKYKETLALKQKKRVPRKKKQKKNDEEEDENVEEEEEEEKEEEMGVEDEESDDEEEEKEEKNAEEEAFKRKCREMDQKKNRLFVKLNKKISNKAQIKELHPDIKDVIFPRKRNTRWCWAVFVSEERADEAMKQLIKNKEVLVSKPTPYEKVYMKKKEKMKTVLRKKEARKKLQNMWM